ncbi:MAG: RNA-binding protein [Acidobacteria bacterium]|nr:MAG: RNA-binding protein [Acidobacteriota bacterium]PIE90342.1 MAG: RNA-binding protein [Acidobacteriota bacterium]
MKLFVGNISWNMDEEALRSEFEPFGAIEECKIIYDRETGRSRGFGFITYTEQESGQHAMEEMNGKEVDGRALKVNEANERPPRNQQRNRW